MTKILDSFASNFQKGGIPFLIFIGALAFGIYKAIRNILPDTDTPEVLAEKEIQDNIANQKGVKDSITSQDKMVANQIFSFCDGLFKHPQELIEVAKYLSSATTTKRVFVAYGIRTVSILWFSGEKKNMVSAIMDKYAFNSDVGMLYSKIFKNANLS